MELQNQDITDYAHQVLSAHIIILRMDAEGYITHFNKFAQDFFGYTEKEIVGRNIVGTIVPERETTGRVLATIMADASQQPEAYYENENENVRRNGERVWVAWHNKPFFDAAGHITEWVCIGSDITKRKRMEQALKKTKREQALILNATSEMFAYYNTELEIQWANKASADSVGLTPDALIGQHCYVVWHQRSTPCEHCPVLKALRTGVAQEAEMTTPDGKIWLLRGYSVFDEGDIVGLVEFGQDITERKRVEDALRRSEQKYRNYIDNAPNGIFIADERGHYLEVNQAACELTGYSRAELLARGIRDTTPPENLTEALADFVKLARTGHTSAQAPFITKDGQRRYWSIEAIKLSDTRFLGFVQDITDQRHAREALRKSERELQLTLDATTEGIWKWDFETNELYFSPRYYTMLGYEPNEFPANFESWQSLLHPDDVDAAIAVSATYLQTKPDTYTNQFRMRTKQGTYRWIHTDARVVERDAQGKAIRMIGNHRDITERKNAEDELRRSAAALQRSNAELQQFAYTVSHDLKEPLRMVKEYLKLLKQNYQGQLDADADDFIHFAVDGAVRMERLIEDLLEYARVDRREQPLILVNCEDVLHQTLDILKLTIVETEAQITHDPLPTVKGDATQLVQVFQNLISNALKFQPRTNGVGGQEKRPPTVHITAREKASNWVFAVQDNGIGIEDAYLTQIFGVFQRLHTRAEYDGTGIGLATCKKIVERHGGEIWVESDVGEGSTFYFTLPKAKT